MKKRRRRRKRYHNGCCHRFSFFVDDGYDRCSISSGGVLRLQTNEQIKKKNLCRKRTVLSPCSHCGQPTGAFLRQKNANADLAFCMLILLLRLLFLLIAYDIIVWSSDRLIISLS